MRGWLRTVDPQLPRSVQTLQAGGSPSRPPGCSISVSGSAPRSAGCSATARRTSPPSPRRRPRWKSDLC